MIFSEAQGENGDTGVDREEKKALRSTLRKQQREEALRAIEEVRLKGLATLKPEPKKEQEQVQA